MITIDTAILAVLAIMILAGLILWQRQTSSRIKIIKNIQRQLQDAQQELQQLNKKIGKAAEGGQAWVNRPVEERPPKEETLKNERLSEEITEQSSETETLEAEPPQERIPELEALETKVTQDFKAAVSAEQSVSKQQQEENADSRDARMNDLDRDIWSQLVEMAEREKQEQKEQGQSADDEKLIDSDQAGEKPDPCGYNVGKSGKIYTEEELELLIKE